MINYLISLFICLNIYSQTITLTFFSKINNVKIQVNDQEAKFSPCIFKVESGQVNVKILKKESTFDTFSFETTEDAIFDITEDKKSTLRIEEAMINFGYDSSEKLEEFYVNSPYGEKDYFNHSNNDKKVYTLKENDTFTLTQKQFDPIRITFTNIIPYRRYVYYPKFKPVATYYTDKIKNELSYRKTIYTISMVGMASYLIYTSTQAISLHKETESSWDNYRNSTKQSLIDKYYNEYSSNRESFKTQFIISSILTAGLIYVHFISDYFDFEELEKLNSNITYKNESLNLNLTYTF